MSARIGWAAIVHQAGEIAGRRGHGADESTKYRGKRYVECYVVKDGVCVAMAHQVVVIK